MTCRSLTAVLLLLVLSAPALRSEETPASSPRAWDCAPLPQPILCPLIQPLVHPRLRGADLLPPGKFLGRFTFATSSIYRGGSAPNASLGLSAQTVHPAGSVRLGLAEGLELGLDLAVYRLEKSWKNEGSFQVFVQVDGKVAADLTGPVEGVSSPVLHLRFNLLDAVSPWVPTLTLSGLFTFPLPPNRSYTRVRGFEAGLLLDATWRRLSPVVVHFCLGWIFEPGLENLGGGSSLPLEDVLYAAIGVLWKPVGFLEFHLSLEGMNNPFPRTGNYRLDHPPVQATLGAAVEFSEYQRFFVTFSEDLSRMAPDFAASAGLEVRLG